MERTISAMLGKGSIRHNTRDFKAANVDAERTQYNIEYCNTSIKEVYCELFDGAVERYNAKQTRADRCIDNYYEKIRTGKQEKLFKEVILQIGKKENMSSISKDGQLAAKFWTSSCKAFRNGILICESSPLTCTWTKLPRIFMWILYRTLLEVSADWTQEYLSNRLSLHKVSQAVLVVIQSGINGSNLKKNSFHLSWSGTELNGSSLALMRRI